MIDEFILLNDWTPSAATLRRWAFDERLFLSDQDEDLVLHQEKYLPVLLALSDEPDCPKSDYILACLDSYLMFLVLQGSRQHLSIVRRAAEQAMHGRRASLREWAALQFRRLSYREGLGPLDKEQAVSMAHDLLNGICRKATITLRAQRAASWEFELSVPPLHHHKERLSIDRFTGCFAFLG